MTAPTNRTGWMGAGAGIARRLVRGQSVSEEEEVEGLDVGEHGMSDYPDFATHASLFGSSAPAPASAARPLATPQQATVER